jgi:hypothetical protein
MQANKQKPQARTSGLLSAPLAEEMMIYDLERDVGIALNPTARRVWQMCDGQTEVRQMAVRLAAEMGAPVNEENEEVVWLALRQLERQRLLEPRLAQESPRFSRRELARRLGLAAAAALPLVTALAIPPAAMAGSLGGPGAPCSSGAECASGVCQMDGTCL